MEMLSKGKTSLNSLVGIGSTIYVDGLKEAVVIVELFFYLLSMMNGKQF